MRPRAGRGPRRVAVAGALLGLLLAGGAPAGPLPAGGNRAGAGVGSGIDRTPVPAETPRAAGLRAAEATVSAAGGLPSEGTGPRRVRSAISLTVVSDGRTVCITRVQGTTCRPAPPPGHRLHVREAVRCREGACRRDFEVSLRPAEMPPAPEPRAAPPAGPR